MAKTREQKEEIVKEIKKLLKDQKLMAFFTFRGLKMEEFSDLRNNVKEKGGLIKVVKKTLFKLSLEKASIKLPDEIFGVKDQFAVLFGFSDDPSILKLIDKLSKSKEGVKIISGYFEGNYLLPQEVKDLASIPSRDALLSKLLWIMNYPKLSFINVIRAPLRDFIFVLSLKAKKRSELN